MIIFEDGRLKVIVRFKRGKNFWYDRETDSYTFCGKWDEIRLMFESLKAVDAYNKRKIENGEQG